MSLFQPLFYVYGKEMLQLAGVCLTNAANHEFSLKKDGRFYLQSFCVDICRLRQNMFCLLTLFCLPVLVFSWSTSLFSSKNSLVPFSLWCFTVGLTVGKRMGHWGGKALSGGGLSLCSSTSPWGDEHSLLEAGCACWGSSRTDWLLFFIFGPLSAF